MPTTLRTTAAQVEGFFRQIVLDRGVRWSVALATAAAWIAFLAIGGRKR